MEKKKGSLVLKPKMWRIYDSFKDSHLLGDKEFRYHNLVISSFTLLLITCSIIQCDIIFFCRYLILICKLCECIYVLKIFL